MAGPTFGLVIVTFLFKPLAKALLKTPWLFITLCLIAFIYVAYLVVRSAYFEDSLE